MEFVMGLVDRIVVMDFGSKLCEGTPGRDPARPAGSGSLSRRGRLMALLSIDDLHVAYDKIEAVRGVSLAIEPGQIVTVIGPNGAGKTTLLSAAIGLLPSSGTMSFDGVDLRRLDVEARVERGFCLVPESGASCSATCASPTIWCSAAMSCVATARACRRAGGRSTVGSPGWTNGAASPHRRCQAASGRCWRWGAP